MTSTPLPPRSHPLSHPPIARSHANISSKKSALLHLISAALFCLISLPLLGLISPQSAAAAPLKPSAAFESAEAAPLSSVRRFALIIAANDGGSERARLRYAISDSERLSKLLTDIGGVRGSDLISVHDPSPALLKEHLLDIGERMKRLRRANERVEVVFYYSGHSDEQGLLLGDERFSWRALRKSINELPADVRIVILDSCASGAMTRAKGGKRRPPFLAGDSTRVEGYAFLTSSSEDEAAQESDRIQGSYFTYHLINGMRGAADVSQDGKITLNEAYQFAFQRTLANTETSLLGPQHAAYDIQLSGSGDLILTDLQSSPSTLTLNASIQGHLSIRNDNDQLVFEVDRSSDSPLDLNLEPGIYQATLKHRNGVSRANVEIPQRGVKTLSFAQFQAVEIEHTVARGGSAPATPITSALSPRPIGGGLQVQETPPGVIALSSPGSIVISSIEDPNLHHFALSISGEHQRVKGLDFSLAGSVVSEDMEGLQLSTVFADAQRLKGIQLSVGFNRVREDYEGLQLAPWFNLSEGTGRGLQLSAGANISNDHRGAQLGIYNNSEVIRGGQVGLMNNSGGLHGGQIGLINIGGQVEGAQIGLINIADNVDGAQIGLINIADHSSASLGLFSFIEDGQQHLDIWGSELGMAHVGAKLGSQHFYLMMTAASQIGEEDPWWMAGGGVGFHLPLESFFLNVEGLSHLVFEKNNMSERRQLMKFRLALGWQASKHFALIGGLSWNTLMVDIGDVAPFGPPPSTTEPSSIADQYGLPFAPKAFAAGRFEKTGELLFIHWPGAFFGFQI